MRCASTSKQYTRYAKKKFPEALEETIIWDHLIA